MANPFYTPDERTQVSMVTTIGSDKRKLRDQIASYVEAFKAAGGEVYKAQPHEHVGDANWLEWVRRQPSARRGNVNSWKNRRFGKESLK